MTLTDNTHDITTDSATTDTARAYRGRTFHTDAGPVILIVPEEEGNWTVLTTSGLESLIIGSPEWADDTDDDTLTDLLVRALRNTKQQADRAQLLVASKEELVQDIRNYAIDRHQAGEICRDGLNRALEHFRLDPFEPRFTVAVVISGTFELNADSEDEALRRVRYLVDGVGFSGQEDSDNLEVSSFDIDVSEAEAL